MNQAKYLTLFLPLREAKVHRSVDTYELPSTRLQCLQAPLPLMGTVPWGLFQDCWGPGHCITNTSLLLCFKLQFLSSLLALRGQGQSRREHKGLKIRSRKQGGLVMAGIGVQTRTGTGFQKEESMENDRKDRKEIRQNGLG